MSWKLAAAFIAVGCVCFVAGLAWAAVFEARERRFLGTRPQSSEPKSSGPESADPETEPQESPHTGSISILHTPPHASAETQARDPRLLIRLVDVEVPEEPANK